MKKVDGYRAENGQFETDIKRAAAWDLYARLNPTSADNISFTACLLIVENRETIELTFKELDIHEHP